MHELPAVCLDEAPELLRLVRRDDWGLRRIVTLVRVVDEIRDVTGLDQPGRPVVVPVAGGRARGIGVWAYDLRPRNHGREPKPAERIRVTLRVERQRVLG